MITKGYFFIELDSNEALDLGSLTKEDWREVDKLAKQVIEDKQTESEKIAFVAGFLHYVMRKQAMKEPFRCQH